MKQLTDKHAWKALEEHAGKIQFYTPSDFLVNEPHRIEDFRIQTTGLTLDFSKQRLTAETLTLLLEYAKSMALEDKIQAMFRGDIVNPSEDRPALHTALRAPKEAQIFVKGTEVVSCVQETLKSIQSIAASIRDKTWRLRDQHHVTDIVNIGIGGSDLGPRFAIDALSAYHHPELRFHFISDACPIGLAEKLNTLNPNHTLFILSSKSMTTPETLQNFHAIQAWMGPHPENDQHFIAVTAKQHHAKSLGINHTLPIWDWVGGRFSMCSAINLITTIAIGFDAFSDLLKGAEAMDNHYRTAPLLKNMPALLALIGFWNNNFLHINHLLSLTYGAPLNYLPAYLQQLEMESNGKSIDLEGRAVNYATCPLIWGGPGNQAQHSYYQLLAQGTHKSAIDFIQLDTLNGTLINRFATAKAKVLSEGTLAEDNPLGFIPGNGSINALHLDALTPRTFGALIALYEHKVYTQSVLWHINPFDQPGVESAKRMSTALVPELG